MRKIIIYLTLSAVLLTGCSARQVEDRLDAAGDMVEDGIDAIVDNTDTTATTSPKISQEEAISIALEHAGVTSDQVTGLRTEYEVDDGVGHYDIRFLLDGREYDYEVDASTGKILSFDRDD